MKIRQRLLIATMLLFILPLISHAGDYVIGEGDGLEIAVWGVKDLTFPVKVRPDGKIRCLVWVMLLLADKPPTAASFVNRKT